MQQTDKRYSPTKQ